MLFPASGGRESGFDGGLRQRTVRREDLGAQESDDSQTPVPARDRGVTAACSSSLHQIPLECPSGLGSEAFVIGGRLRGVAARNVSSSPAQCPGVIRCGFGLLHLLPDYPHDLLSWVRWERPTRGWMGNLDSRGIADMRRFNLTFDV